MFQHLASWLESHMGTCRFHEQTGILCPGCGLQRSVTALLEGRLGESLAMFPALLPLLFMFSFLGIHLVFKLRHGALVLKIMYIVNISVILANFLVKLIINR